MVGSINPANIDPQSMLYPTRGRDTAAAPNSRSSSRVRRASLAGLFALVLTAGFGQAETLRVTSWNWGVGLESQAEMRLVEEGAATLKALDPDVILLQGVLDWHMCAELTAALAPAEYSVLICSAFQGSSITATGQAQVAILSKTKAFVTWSDVWPSQKQQLLPQGMAFAAIQTGTQRVGFFTALAGNRRSADELPQSILQAVNSIGRWETNQIQTFVIAASFDPGMGAPTKARRNTSSVLERAGFVDASEQEPIDLRNTWQPTAIGTRAIADGLFAGPMGFPMNTRITAASRFAHSPLTCDLELDPDKVTAALALRTESQREQEDQRVALIRRIENWGTGGLILSLVILLRWRLRRAKRSLPMMANRKDLPAPPPIPRAAPAVRPIIFVQAPQQERPAQLPIAPQVARTRLRLQSSPRETRDPKNDSAAEMPSSTGVSIRQESALDPGSPRLEPPAPESARGNDAEVRQGLIKELSAWLKNKLVRRLVSDRAQLLEAQHLATRMASTLDNRLARIEEQIQQQNLAYVRRIEELNRELASAREENRELIRERIAQVKAEMEAARAKVLAEANLDNTSLRL